MCAQRLSASRIISARQVAALVTVHGCSTPFGITDYIGDGGGTAADVFVAGECSTPFGITDYIGQHHVGLPDGRSDVLNAFRHHGLYRPPLRRMDDILSAEVLNAFRHHGLYRRGAWRALDVMDECSTPFGITDYIGPSG